MSTYQAKRQFEENLKLFGNPQSEPEKFNLYGGLINISKAISKIESDLDRLKEEIQKLKLI